MRGEIDRGKSYLTQNLCIVAASPVVLELWLGEIHGQTTGIFSRCLWARSLREGVMFYALVHSLTVTIKKNSVPCTEYLLMLGTLFRIL